MFEKEPQKRIGGRPCLADAQLMNFNLGRFIPQGARRHLFSCPACTERMRELESSLCAEALLKARPQENRPFGAVAANGVG